MERSGKRKRTRGGASSSTTRLERKTVEKIRRNKMKNLYSILNSLFVSNNNSHDGKKEEKSLPDQIDKATNYIKYLEASVDEAKKKMESLLTAGKRLINPAMDHCSSIISTTNLETFISPELDIRVQGSFMDVTLIISGNQFIVSDVIRVIREERAMVVNANFSVLGCSVYLLIHAEIGKGAEAKVIIKRLKKLVNGSSTEDSGQFDQLDQHLWDFDISMNTWEFKDSPNIWEFDMFHALHWA